MPLVKWGANAARAASHAKRTLATPTLVFITYETTLLRGRPLDGFGQGAVVVAVAGARAGLGMLGLDHCSRGRLLMVVPLLLLLLLLLMVVLLLLLLVVPLLLLLLVVVGGWLGPTRWCGWLVQRVWRMTTFPLLDLLEVALQGALSWDLHDGAGEGGGMGEISYDFNSHRNIVLFRCKPVSPKLKMISQYTTYE